MSLLLDALKKAEKAKEEAQQRARRESPPSGLHLQDDPPPEKPVTTRAELPDISQPLEILSDDIAPAGRGGAGQRPARPAASGSRPQPAARQAAEPPAENAAERATARKVFEVKHKEPNPRLPFYITMGALGVAVVCTAVYFWYQLQPPPSLVNANPRPAPAQEVASAPAPAPVPAPSASAPAIPGLPGSPAPAAAVPEAARPEAAASAPPSAAPPAAAPASPSTGIPAPRRRARTTTTKSAPALQRALPAPQRDVSVAPRAPAQVHPRVEAAYATYLAGDMAAARAGYMDALRDEPANRDALLGLAAVEVRSGRPDLATATYLKLLRADPRDPHAQAGLIALRGEHMGPLAAETRLKTLLAAEPEAHVLNFALGNQLALQERWPEAQQQYFKAFSADPANPDFAYNVAVSLDHMRQPRLALEYYRRALALAAQRSASFDAAAVRQRVSQLGN